MIKLGGVVRLLYGNAEKTSTPHRMPLCFSVSLLCRVLVRYCDSRNVKGFLEFLETDNFIGKESCEFCSLGPGL